MRPFPLFTSSSCMGLLLGVDEEAMVLLNVAAIAISGLVFKGRPNLMAYVVGCRIETTAWFSLPCRQSSSHGGRMEQAD